MDVGSKIGQKMRLAIKVKLREMGCYVDDELPDYVMVMVANKRTRTQMEEDLLLFLGDNTEIFVNWLHQVLKKLQEVTISAPIVEGESTDKPTPESSKEKDHVKEKKHKEKDKIKEKLKKLDSKESKKSKKKDRDKDKSREHKNRSDKKPHKKKKKHKDTTIKRPNIPPLLMNMEKNSEPSITDVFAGQILKNHGVLLDNPSEKEKNKDSKDISLPLTDPDSSNSKDSSQEISAETDAPIQPKKEEDKIKEITEIELKIEGLKRKLSLELENGGTDDDDFVNIRTEREELIADFADDVIQEITSTQPPVEPNELKSSPEPNIPKSPEVGETEILPQIELKLPKRPVRTRLGEQIDSPKTMDEAESSSKDIEKYERYTPDKQLLEKPTKCLRDRLGSPVDRNKRRKSSDKDESTSKKNKSSRHSKALESRSWRGAPASIVRVQPRPRPVSAAPASNLLFKAVADAQKSMQKPSNTNQPPSKIKQALVMPMPRSEAQKIVISVSGDSVQLTSPPDGSDCEIDIDTESLADLENLDENKNDCSENEYVPTPLNRKVKNTAKYVPTKRDDEKSSNDSLDLNNFSIHTKSKDSANNPQFVVTLEGLDPNIFLAKKLKTEGLIDEAEEMAILKNKSKKSTTKAVIPENILEKSTIETAKISEGKKRLSDTSDDSGTQVIIKQENDTQKVKKPIREVNFVNTEPETRKRKASPIVFNDTKREKSKENGRERERSISGSSDNHNVIITTNPTHKYDAVPSLSQAQQEKKPVPCRSFPACRFGDACAFLHPPCKFLSNCGRQHCPYRHPANPKPIASTVVPSANYKTISSSSSPAMCKYYPHCSNPGCHYFHPKPCRYGKACTNKLECNYYHHDVTNMALKWRSSKV